MTWKNTDWKGYVEGRGGELLVDLDGKPGNEDDEHFMKKLAMAQWSLESTPRDVEVYTEWKVEEKDGIRFDVYYESKGKSVGLEAGELNTSTEEMELFLKERSEYVDTLIWWPYDQKRLVRWMADHQPYCDVCLEEKGDVRESYEYIGEVPALNVRGVPEDPNMTIFDLEHLCSPEEWHNDTGIISRKEIEEECLRN